VQKREKVNTEDWRDWKLNLRESAHCGFGQITLNLAPGLFEFKCCGIVLVL
jgi:hypothetical protein